MPTSPFEVPLFPLPSLLVYPGRVLPLHIFEPRYRALMKDAMAGEGRFAMAVLCPGWEPQYDERPAIFPTVCVGRVTKYRELPDGRFVLHLLGETRASLREERAGKPYRVGRVEPIPDHPIAPDVEEIRRRELRSALEGLVGHTITPPSPDGDDARPATAALIADEACLQLPLPIERKMAIHAMPCQAARSRAVLDAIREIHAIRADLGRCTKRSPDDTSCN